MKRVNELLRDPEFLEHMRKNREAEADRSYCRHDLNHALDVARVAHILNLEGKLGLDKEVVYAAALVHDIGRWMEYASGIGHDQASQALAEGLLKKSGYSGRETEDILEAVGSHRREGSASPLSDLLYRADKLSRNCSVCGAISTCKRFAGNETPYLNY
jgi:uncharacterized protein